MEREERGLFEILKEILRGYGFSPILAWALRFFLRNPYESVVVVDKAGNVEFMDRGSEKIFGLPEGGAKGVRITQLVPNSIFPRVLETGKAVTGRIFDVKDMPRIGSTYPLIKDGEIIGAVGHLILSSLEEMERINTKMKTLENEVKSLKRRQIDGHRVIYSFENILGVSTAIKASIEMAKKAALIDTDILIIGESGTGKELFAQAIHSLAIPERPFVSVNCPAIPFELAESELFGYERGAFSGARTSGKPGKFELAHKGTLFLDEISALPISIQSKVLRALEEREVERLGSTRIRKFDFRVIAATNVDLKQFIKAQKFRADLYYRIAKVNIHISPVRERKEDIPVYVDFFLKAINDRFGTHFKKLSNEAFLAFVNYAWPGNVREIINILEQSSLRKWIGEEIPISSLPSEIIGSSSLETPAFSRNFKEGLKKTERELILQALRNAEGNKRRAAFLLHMPRSTLYKKLKDYSIVV